MVKVNSGSSHEMRHNSILVEMYMPNEMPYAKNMHQRSMRCRRINVSKMSARFSSMKHLEPIFAILAQNILIFLGSKRMHNFLPHLSCCCYATREYISNQNKRTVFRWVGGHLYRSRIRPTDDQKIPVFLEKISSTD